MPEPALERRLAAILAADVVGYSRLMAADESATHARLKAARSELLEPAVRQHGGRIVKLMGDGVLIEFPSVVGAVACAVAIQRDLEARERERPADQRIRLRIGINLGDIIHDDGDIYGDGVNVAARLEALAEPGGILVSGSVHDHLRGKTDLAFEPLGPQRLKNIPEPVAVYRVAGITDGRRSGRVRQPRRLLPLAALALVLVISAGAALWWYAGRPAPPGDLDRPSIAILPFDNFDPDEAYFGEGLAGDLITDLAKISGLTVVGRSAAFAYAASRQSVTEIAAELGVRYVLEGDVRRAGEELRINMQLIDTATGTHLWAERFERDAADVFAVQDEVRQKVVEVLAVRLSPAESARLERLPTTNLEAYDYYLRAEHAARTGFQPQLREALQLYARATALDPNFALAFAADARTAADVIRNNYDRVLPAPLARQRAYAHASRALALDPDAALPLAVLAVLQMVDRRHDAAIASAERAVALAPNDAEAQAVLALVLTFSGQHAAAVAAVERTLELDPQPPIHDRVVGGMAHFLNDQAGEAILILEQARAAAPNVDNVHAVLAAAYATAGRADDARRAAAEAERLAVGLCTELYRVAFGHFREPADLDKMLDAMLAAGLPKWPFGFDADSREHLSAAALRPLVFGRTWQGRVEPGDPALAQFQANGQMAFRTASSIATGTAFVDGDRLCEQVESSIMGRPLCGPVMRQPPGTSEDGTDYTYVNGSKVFHFAVVD